MQVCQRQHATRWLALSSHQLEEQIADYFGNNGIAGAAAESLGVTFVKTNVKGSLVQSLPQLMAHTYNKL